MRECLGCDEEMAMRYVLSDVTRHLHRRMEWKCDCCHTFIVLCEDGEREVLLHNGEDWLGIVHMKDGRLWVSAKERIQ